MKRTEEMNKYYKEILEKLDTNLGEADAYLLLVILTKALDKALGNKDIVELHTFAISFNDEEPIEWDFNTEDFVHKGE